MGAFAAISAAFFYLPFLWAFGESDVILLESCAGDVAPWLYGTRFCAEYRDECLLVPACLLEFLLKDVLWPFLPVLRTGVVRRRILGRHISLIRFTFPMVCRARSSLHLNQADRIKLKMSFANKKSDCFIISKKSGRYSSRVISD